MTAEMGRWMGQHDQPRPRSAAMRGGHSDNAINARGVWRCGRDRHKNTGQKLIECAQRLLELAASLLGNPVVAAALAFDGLTVALDPTRFLHRVEQRVQRARAYL